MPRENLPVHVTFGDVVAALSLGNGFYAAALAGAAASVLGLDLPPVFFVWVFLAAWGAFMLDRIKLADRLAEPGDEIAHPGRSAFIRRHTRILRTGMVFVGVAGFGVGLSIHPVAAIATLASWLGVIAYSIAWPADEAGGDAGAPVPRRLKSVPLVKNLLVGIAFGVLAVLTVVLEAALLGINTRGPSPVHPGVVVGWLTLLVTADAVLCDVGDEAGDHAANVRTLVVLHGRRGAIAAALVLHAAAAATLLVTMFGASVPGTVLFWAIVPMVTAAAAVIIKPYCPGTLIDWRLPVVVIVTAV